MGVRYGSIKKLTTLGTMTATTRRDERVEKYLCEEKGTRDELNSRAVAFFGYKVSV